MAAVRTAFSCLAALALAAVAARAQEARPAADILREFRSIHFPGFSSGSDPAAVAAFRKEVEDAAARQCALARELWETHPDHSAVPELLAARWALTVNTFRQPARVLEETADVLGGDVDAGVRIAALHGRAWAALGTETLAAREKLEHVQRVFEADPDNARCGQYFVKFLQAEALELDSMRALCESAIERWPDDSWTARPARAVLKQLDRIGKPLPFDVDPVLDPDAAPGHTVVVVWSSPSEETAATLREVQGWASRFDGLRAAGVVNYRIEGGADALAAHLEEWAIGFPQLYDAEKIETPWDSPYATPRTPFFYLLGPDGNVLRFAYDARVMARILADALRPRRASD